MSNPANNPVWKKYIKGEIINFEFLCMYKKCKNQVNIVTKNFWETTAEEGDEWSPILDIPKKNKKSHFCETSHGGIFCFEDDKPKKSLHLAAYSQMGRMVNIEIVACPFCGFTLDEK